MSRDLRAAVIQVGVKQLRESYPDVNEQNIMTDYVYARFFEGSLKETLEDPKANSIIRRVCRELLAEVAETKAKDA